MLTNHGNIKRAVRNGVCFLAYSHLFGNSKASEIAKSKKISFETAFATVWKDSENAELRKAYNAEKNSK